MIETIYPTGQSKLELGVMIIKKTKKGESICIHYIGKANCGFR